MRQSERSPKGIQRHSLNLRSSRAALLEITYWPGRAPNTQLKGRPSNSTSTISDDHNPRQVRTELARGEGTRRCGAEAFTRCLPACLPWQSTLNVVFPTFCVLFYLSSPSGATDQDILVGVTEKFHVIEK